MNHPIDVSKLLGSASLRMNLPELLTIAVVAQEAEKLGTVRVETVLKHKKQLFPIYSFAFGSEDKTAPVIVLVGGVHGLERIGTKIIVNFMQNFLEFMKWDECLRFALKRCRVLIYPLVNPVGMYLKMRSNPKGVDLMRNAPIDAKETPNIWPLCGHRISNALPWYRGQLADPMQQEAQALCSFIKREMFQSRCAISLDVHSGFGVRDRLWFPYAGSREPFPNVAEVFAFKRLLDKTLPNHVYRIEPQAHQYLAHGDIWDYLHLEHQKHREGASPFLPLSLELGSWAWVKKNPRQFFSALGAFNPILPHRLQRTLRRHFTLIDFLIRASVSYEKWVGKDPQQKSELHDQAIELWFSKERRKAKEKRKG